MRDPKQRAAALHQANLVRAKRKELRIQIRRRETNLAGLLLHVPSEIERMEIGELLRWQRGIGITKATQMLRGQGISETRRVRELTDRQRGNLALTAALCDRNGPRGPKWAY